MNYNEMDESGCNDSYFKNETYLMKGEEMFAAKEDEMFSVKEELDSSMSDVLLTSTSACMPIPGRRPMDITQIQDCDMAYITTSPLILQDANTSLNNSVWSAKIVDSDVKMEDDDIFQVDKSDLIQGSHFVELHGNRDLLEELSFDDLVLPGELSCVVNVPGTSRNSPGSHPLTNTPANSFGSSYASSSLLTENVRDSPDSLPSSPQHVVSENAKTYVSLSQSNSNFPLVTSPAHTGRHSSLHELLLRKDPLLSASSSTVLGQSVPGGNMYNSRSLSFKCNPSRLSSSAPTHLGLDQIWQRREPRQHLLSTGSLVEGGSTSSLSTGGILSPDACDFSLDEMCDSDDESDDEFSSDAESSDGEGGTSSSLTSRSSKKERYFWQYNVQSKGPKGQRLVLKSQLEDPHCLNEIQDPVFSPDCSLQGIKHSGKARKGDGNDLTPNPKKLHAIGKELDKLNRVINDMTPVSELPFNVRPNTRKEKNKLASRACRLKKKAQHEANKIKLLGLETEHKRLLQCINQVHQVITSKASNPDNEQDMSKNIDKVIKHASKLRIAGHTTEFVNKILEKLRQGMPNGGLDDLYVTGYTSAIPPLPPQETAAAPLSSSRL